MGLQQQQENFFVDKVISDQDARFKELQDRIAFLESQEAARDFRLFEDKNLIGSLADLDFQTIIQTYTHLLVKGSLRGDDPAVAQPLRFRINNTATANYDYIRTNLFHSAAQASVESVAPATFADVGAASTAGSPANTFTSFELFIPDYLEATQLHSWHGTVFLLQTAVTGNLFTMHFGGRFRVAGAINRITLSLNAGNFVAGTRCSLYGLR